MEDYSRIQLPWPDWKITQYLGGGGYGKVYRIERNISGVSEKAALKIVSRPKNESELNDWYGNGYDQDRVLDSFDKEIQNYLKEYQLMRELQGQSNIVSVDDFALVKHKNGIGGDIFIRMELRSTPLLK